MHLVLFVLSLMAQPNQTHSVCAEMFWTEEDEGYPTVNRDVLNIVSALRTTGVIAMEIAVCSSQAGTVAGTVPMPSSMTHMDSDKVVRGYVHIPDMVIQQFNHSELRGVLAHEVAHLEIPKSADCQMMPLRLDPVTNEEHVACESPADALAARWVGRDVVIQALRAIPRLLEPYVGENKASLENLNERIRLRIAALTK